MRSTAPTWSMVEQNVRMALLLAPTILDHGEKIAEVTPDDVRDDHPIIEACLGREMSDDDVRMAP